MSEVQILLLLLLSGYLISVSLGMVIIPRILVISHKKRLYDVPDSRKVHTTPVPRLGGLSFFPVVLMSFALVIGFRLYLWPSDLSSFSIEMLHEYLFLFVGMTLLYLVGVCDDLVGVGYRYKFIVQVVLFVFFFFFFFFFFFLAIGSIRWEAYSGSIRSRPCWVCQSRFSPWFM